MNKQSQNMMRRWVSILVIVCVLISNAPASALEKQNSSRRYYNIRQESFANGGVLVSRPKPIDTKIFNLVSLNHINSFEDYSRWLQENVEYQKDDLIDVWSDPRETLRKKKGDCEDFAFLTSAVVRVLGYEPKTVAFVQTENPKRGHAICVFKFKGYYVWFDNAKFKKTEATSLEEFANGLMDEHDYARMMELNAETNKWKTIFEKA